MSEAVETARAAFERHFGTAPQGVALAPGRVNLIGDHVDYNDGLVLPMPLAVGTAVAFGPADGAIEAVAVDFGEENDSFAAGEVPTSGEGWRAYFRGMVAMLAESGIETGGCRLAIAGDMPRGTGLSSSASLEIAIGRALAALAGSEVSPEELSRAAQATEHRYAGVNCGIMDQMASAAGKPDHAMLLDCRDLSYENIPLPEDWAVLIVQSGVERGLVDGEYNIRRAQCERAAEAMGVASLRDATIAMLDEADLDIEAEIRARHVIEEIARVRDAATALRAADLATFGRLLKESHMSHRDLFENSHPQVDRLVERLKGLIGSEGGARMTGGGFGGAVVAVMATSEVERVETELRRLQDADGTGTKTMRARATS